MRLLLFLVALCLSSAGFSQEAVEGNRPPVLSNGMVGVVCTAKWSGANGEDRVDLAIPLPDQQRVKTVHYTVAGGEKRTKTIHYWTHSPKSRSVRLTDLTAYRVDGQPMDAATARRRLRDETRVLLGFLPSESARSILKDDTIVLVPKEGIVIKDFRPPPF